MSLALPTPMVVRRRIDGNGMRGADSHRVHIFKNVFGELHAVGLNQQNRVEALTVSVSDTDWLDAYDFSTLYGKTGGTFRRQ